MPKKSTKKSSGKSSGKPAANSLNIKLKNPSQKITGFCLKCKKKGILIQNCNFFMNKNGSIRASGTCPKCGTGVNAFMSRNDFN